VCLRLQNGDAVSGAVAGLALDVNACIDKPGAFVHIDDAGTFFFGALAEGFGYVEANAIVGNGKGKSVCCIIELGGDGLGIGIFNDVVEYFLAEAEENDFVFGPEAEFLPGFINSDFIFFGFGEAFEFVVEGFAEADVHDMIGIEAGAEGFEFGEQLFGQRFGFDDGFAHLLAALGEDFGEIDIDEGNEVAEIGMEFFGDMIEGLLLYFEFGLQEGLVEGFPQFEQVALVFKPFPLVEEKKVDDTADEEQYNPNCNSHGSIIHFLIWVYSESQQ
jgi:hypothetical protein